MLFQSYRFALAQKKVQQLQTDRKKQLLNYEKVKIVFLLTVFENEQKLFLIEKYLCFLQEKLGIQKIHKLIFFPDQKQPELLLSKWDFILDKKDRTFWLQLAEKEKLKFFQNLSVDLLIDTSDAKQWFLKSIVATATATCKIGFCQQEWEKIYDFWVDLPIQDTEGFFDFLKTFLLKVNKN